MADQGAPRMLWWAVTIGALLVGGAAGVHLVASSSDLVARFGDVLFLLAAALALSVSVVELRRSDRAAVERIDWDDAASLSLVVRERQRSLARETRWLAMAGLATLGLLVVLGSVTVEAFESHTITIVDPSGGGSMVEESDWSAATIASFVLFLVFGLALTLVSLWYVVWVWHGRQALALEHHSLRALANEDEATRARVLDEELQRIPALAPNGPELGHSWWHGQVTGRVERFAVHQADRLSREGNVEALIAHYERMAAIGPAGFAMASLAKLYLDLGDRRMAQEVVDALADVDRASWEALLDAPELEELRVRDGA